MLCTASLACSAHSSELAAERIIRRLTSAYNLARVGEIPGTVLRMTVLQSSQLAVGAEQLLRRTVR